MILNSPYITGSLTVTGNITASGGITISGSILSASYAANAGLLSGLASGSFVSTSSFTTVSGSFSTRVSTIEGSYATTGSNVFVGNQTVCANLTTTGTITAQTINVQQVTSSIVYSSGSNIFGCLPSDVQQMTGSLRVTGSGNHWFRSGCVGIGLTNPTNLLEVQGGDVKLNAGASRCTSVFFGITGTNYGKIQYSDMDGSMFITTIGSGGGYDLNIGTKENIRLNISGNGAACFACGLSIPSALINTSTFSKGAKLEIVQGSTNTNGIDLKNTDATYGHIGTFANNLYLTQNYYYAGGQNNDSATYGQAAIILGAGTTTTSTISFDLSDAGATSPSNKMRILSNGNVGVGATNPIQKFTVIGGISGSLLTQESTVKFVNTGSLYTKFTLSDNVNYDGVISMENNGTKANTKLRIYIGNATSELNDHITLTGGGNVGIGTSSPGQKLEVVGGEIKAGRVDSSQEGGQVSFGRASDNATGWYLDVYGSTSTPSLRFVDVSNSAVRMTLDGSGNTTLGGGIAGGAVYALSGYVNETQTISTPAVVYYLNKDQGNAGGSSSTTFNITGIPNVDGAFALLYLRSSNTTAGINVGITVQVHGNTIFSTSTQNVTKTASFYVFKANGSWFTSAVGTGSTAGYP